ncbi:MAG: hypothetical protein EP343_27590 [Deltaproteobacteria bacterium]|nr:MAG: hypothetical protein EP343_27590 [Deltaproteobacteria bacterium]
MTNPPTTPSNKPSQDESQASTTAERTEEELLSQTADSKEEQEEISALLREMKGKRPVMFPWTRRILWAVGIATFLALGVLTAVLVRNVQLATRVYGPKVVASGGHANYRVSVFDPEKTEFFNDLTGSIWLVGKNKRKRLYHGKTQGKVLLANVDIPAWPPGDDYKLEIRVDCPEGTERLVRPIALRPASSLKSNYTSEQGKRAWVFTSTSTNNPYRIQLFAENRAPVADLLTHFWLQVEEKPTSPKPKEPKKPTSQPTPPNSRPTTQAKSGQPTQPKAQTQPTVRSAQKRSKAPLNPFAPRPRPKPAKPKPDWVPAKQPLQVTVEHGRSRHNQLKVNPLGYVRFPYVPQLFDEPWKITLKGPRGTFVFVGKLKPEGYQLVLDVPKVITPHGQPLFFRVDGLHGNSDLHVDITQNGQRLWSHKAKLQGGRAAINLKLPPYIRGLVGVQVYTEFYFPGEIHDERLVYIGNPDRNTLLKALQQHLKARGEALQALALKDWQKFLSPKALRDDWVVPVFSLSKARFVPPTLYYNSAEDRLRRLRTYQKVFRSRTMILLVGLGGCVLLTVFSMLIIGYRRDQRRMREMAEEHEELDVVESRGLPLLVTFLIVLTVLFAIIIVLFWAMQWTYDNI